MISAAAPDYLLKKTPVIVVWPSPEHTPFVWPPQNAPSAFVLPQDLVSKVVSSTAEASGLYSGQLGSHDYESDEGAFL